MERWLEEYFAELEAAFGLGLFERAGKAGETGQERLLSRQSAEELPAVSRAEALGQEEALLRQVRTAEQFAAEDERAMLWAEDWPETQAVGSGMLPEDGGFTAPDEPDVEVASQRVMLLRQQMQAEEMLQAAGEAEETGKGMLWAETMALPFSDVLPEVQQMEQGRVSMREDAGESGSVRLWQDAVKLVSADPEELRTAAQAVSGVDFAEAEDHDELVDELLDALERRLMLEVGGSAEGVFR